MNEQPRNGPGLISYPVRVLFLCTGNSARTQIAEALMRKKGGHRFVVASAGAKPAAAVKPEAIDALRGIGIDWNHAKSKGIDAISDQPWDLVLTLCDRTKEACASLPGRPVTGHWGVPDPAAVPESGRERAYSQVVALLSWRIDLMLSLSAENFERLVLEERIRAIGNVTEPGEQPSL